MVVVLILMGGLVAAIGGFFWLGDKTQFRPEVREALGAISEGRADEVWRDSSYLLRRSMNLDAFSDMGARMNETLGTFERITDVLEVSRSTSRAGKVGQVVCELQFAHGVTTGTFAFHRGPDDDRWRLLGIDVIIPAPRQQRARELEHQFERVRAPDEVLFALSRILREIRDGDSRRVWEDSAQPFRESVSAEKFVELNRDLENELGKFVRVLTIISSGLHPDKDKAKVNALIEYEKTRTNGLFSFVKVDDTWQLSFYKPLVPEPVFPGREPGVFGEPFVPPDISGDLGAIEDGEEGGEVDPDEAGGAD